MSIAPTLAAIRQRLAEIGEVERKLAAEKQELQIAERVVARLEPMAEQRVGTMSATLVSPKPMGQHDLTVSVLRSAPNPWFESWAELRDEIARLHGVEIKKSSFQPLLSHMARDGIIARDGAKVALAERVKQKENAETETAAP